MYIDDRFILRDTIEHEIKFVGKYGAAGEKRAKKEKPTSDEQKMINLKKKEKLIRRVINLNFAPDDLWITLKYQSGFRQKDLTKVKNDLKNFLRRLKRRYQKHDRVLKYVYRIEVGKRGGVHVHLLVNRIPDTDLMLKECWDMEKAAGVWMTHIYEEGSYKKLAEYIVKIPEEDEVKGQLSLFDLEDQKTLIKYSCSRNLIRPVPDRKTYTRRTLRKILVDGIIKPAKGYVIDKSSIYQGINRFTGMSYLYYTEIKIKSPPGKESDSG